jgi:hypothetical protein
LIAKIEKDVFALKKWVAKIESKFAGPDVNALTNLASRTDHCNMYKLQKT